MVRPMGDVALRDEVCTWLLGLGVHPHVIVDEPGCVTVEPVAEGRLEVRYAEIVLEGPTPELPPSWPPAEGRNRVPRAQLDAGGVIVKRDRTLITEDPPPGYLWDGDLVWDAWRYIRRIPRTNLPKEGITWTN